MAGGVRLGDGDDPRHVARELRGGRPRIRGDEDRCRGRAAPRSASVRASVATSAELFASDPSAFVSATTQIAPFAPAIR